MNHLSPRIHDQLTAHGHVEPTSTNAIVRFLAIRSEDKAKAIGILAAVARRHHFNLDGRTLTSAEVDHEVFNAQAGLDSCANALALLYFSDVRQGYRYWSILKDDSNGIPIYAWLYFTVPTMEQLGFACAAIGTVVGAMRYVVGGGN